LPKPLATVVPPVPAPPAAGVDLPAGSGRTLWWRWVRYFLPWALVLIISLAFYFKDRANDAVLAIEAEHAALIRNGDATATRMIQRVMSDTLLMSGGGALSRYVAGGSPAARAELGEEWVDVLRAMQVYDQVRFLDLTGRERVRVNFNDGQPGVVPDHLLQDKSDRVYFKQARDLGRGDFYLSPLDLNVENGKVEMPPKPVIRVAMPVFDRQGIRRGVLVVNYLANELLFRIGAMASASGVRLAVFNAEGYWLTGGEPGDEWAFVFGRAGTLETRFPGAWPRLLASDQGKFQDRHGLWLWSTVYPMVAAQTVSVAVNPRFSSVRTPAEQNALFWKVVSRVDQEKLDEIRQHSLRQLIISLTCGLLLLVLAAWRLALARQQQERAEESLRQLNQSLESQVTERTRRLQNEIFDRQMAERRYRESSEQYQQMLATTIDAYWLLDDRGGFLDANQTACTMLGVPRDVLLSMTMGDFDADPEGADLEGRIAELMLAGAKRFETRLKTSTGKLIEVEISASYLPEYQRFLVFVRDISERQQFERERRLAAMVMANADEAIFVAAADGKVLSANPAFSRVTGISQYDALRSQVDQLGITAVDGKLPLSRMLAMRPTWRSEMRGRRSTGEVYPVWFSATEVSAESGSPHHVCVFSDITEIKESQARLDFLAHHDALTGLPNRLLFHARLEHSLERAERAKTRVAVMFLDLDRFKEVNDSLGHAVGDQLLIDLAAAMSDCLRGEDTLARLGGDEFVILIENVVGNESVDAVIEKLKLVFPWVVSSGSHRIEVTVSIGVAIFPENATDADSLVMRADAAMYRSKEKGRNCATYV